jgi:hypothetical protein
MRMKNGLFVIAIALGVGIAFLIPVSSNGQDEAPKGDAPKGGGKGGFGKGGGKGKGPAVPAGPMPRLPDGHPDMQGYWNGPAVTDVQATGRGGAPGTIVDPADGKIPFTPAEAARIKETREHDAVDEPTLHCFETGVPKNMWLQFGFQILQDPNHFVVLHEIMHQVRIINLDNRPHIPANIHLFQGDSIGHWDGDTLVVETTNHGDKNWYDDTGTAKPQTVHVVERFIPVDANTITLESTMTDPTAYTAPWTTRVTMRRANAKMPDGSRDYEQMEFGCVEGNADLDHYTEDKGGKKKVVRVPTAKQ